MLLQRRLRDNAPTDTSQPWLSWERSGQGNTGQQRHGARGTGPHYPLLCPTWKRPRDLPEGKVCKYKHYTLETHMKIQLGSSRNSIPRVIPRTKRQNRSICFVRKPDHKTSASFPSVCTGRASGSTASLAFPAKLLE